MVYEFNYNTGDSCTPGNIRLYNDSTSGSPTTGMLQICDSNKKWTAVCGYNWTCNHAFVACKQLNFTNFSKCFLSDKSLLIF